MARTVLVMEYRTVQIEETEISANGSACSGDGVSVCTD